MRVRFWGVRGALTTTEPSAQGVGGNTPCVEVRDAEDGLLILDAGIGLYWLGRSLLAGPLGRGKGEATLLLSHTHWDHIQGFPFFVPAYIPGNRLHVWGGARLEDILEGQLNPIYSPIVSLQNMGAKITITPLTQGEVVAAGRIKVTHAVVTNVDQDCVGYRLEEDGRTLAYVCEVHHPGGVPTAAARALARGADVLIHEAYYTNDEAARGGLGLAGPASPGAVGHSSFAQATDLALEAGCKRVLYFYHHPDHDDATVEAAVAAERARVAALGSSLVVEAAREGYEVRV